MLRLPDTPALDTRVCVERVDDAPSEYVSCDQRRGKEEILSDRRRGSLEPARGGLAEQKPEPWSGGTKPSRRRHREVQLQRVRQQEHTVGGRPPFELGEPHRVELIDQCARPVVEHIRDPNTVGDAEGEVDVGEAVAATYGERAHDGSRDDAIILLREPEHALTKSIPLLNGEHAVAIVALNPTALGRPIVATDVPAARA